MHARDDDDDDNDDDDDDDDYDYSVIHRAPWETDRDRQIISAGRCSSAPPP